MCSVQRRWLWARSCVAVLSITQADYLGTSTSYTLFLTTTILRLKRNLNRHARPYS